MINSTGKQSGKPIGQFWRSLINNDSTYMQYYMRLVELSISMFEWKNLPETVDERFLELCLFTDGMCLFFEDEEIGYLGLRCMIGGELDVYNIPTERHAYAPNGYENTLTEDDSVIIFNNLIHTNSMLDVEQFALRLYNLDRIIDVNANAQKTPVLITGDEKTILSLKNVYMQYDGNAPVIYANKSLKPDALKVLMTNAPFIADDIYKLKVQYWNEALTYLGISNVNIQKKERLITDEVMRIQGGVIASRYSRLESRRQACKKINKKFGLKIWCDYREDFHVIDENAIISENEDLKNEV